MPPQLAVALLIRKPIRIKSVINLLHDFGISADYNRRLLLKKQIVETVLKQMSLKDIIYGISIYEYP